MNSPEKELRKITKDKMESMLKNLEGLLNRNYSQGEKKELIEKL